MIRKKGESPYVIEPLARTHDRTTFSSGKESLDRYIREQASQDSKRHYAAPFVLTERGDAEVLGYYTLSSFGIHLTDLPETTIQKLPRYPLVPATLLGRLAVDQKHQGKGLGELLLLDALYRSLKQADVIGSAAIVVDAIDETAYRFYRHFGFLPFPEQGNRLFLPMKTILKLF